MDKESEQRLNFITAHGFKNMSDFAKAIGDERQNVYKVIHGKQQLTVKRMVKYCNVLGCSIIELLYVFYPKEMKEYFRRYINE